MSEQVHWPADYAPEQSPIHAVNEIDIAAPPAVVWALLSDAERWADYYPHASDVHIMGNEPALEKGSHFRWRTAGIELNSTVRECEIERRLAWDAVHDDSTAYHAWLITATPTGCHVRTEETRQGPYWEESARTRPDGLYSVHQDWVEALARAAAYATQHPGDGIARPS